MFALFRLDEPTIYRSVVWRGRRVSSEFNGGVESPHPATLERNYACVLASQHQCQRRWSFHISHGELCDSSKGSGYFQKANLRFGSWTGDASLCPWERHFVFEVPLKNISEIQYLFCLFRFVCTHAVLTFWCSVCSAQTGQFLLHKFRKLNDIHSSFVPLFEENQCSGMCVVQTNGIIMINFLRSFVSYTSTCILSDETSIALDGSLPANPVNNRRIANAVTLKSTFCLP